MLKLRELTCYSMFIGGTHFSDMSKLAVIFIEGIRVIERFYNGSILSIHVVFYLRSVVLLGPQRS